MSGQHGVKNLWPMVALGVELGNVADDFGRSKGAARYLHLMDLFDELMGLGKVDFKLAKEELKELDGADRDELKSLTKAKFDIEDDKLEHAIEEAMDILEMQYQVVDKSLALAKSLKKSE